MSGPIVVINPNSNRAVTEGLDRALDGFRFADGPPIECLTLPEGPFGIESQVQSDQVVQPLVALVQSRPDAAAFVIACYSDPGLAACREVAKVPVFGIQESGILAAMGRGDMVGVISLSQASVVRHRAYMRRMGVSLRISWDLAVDLSVAESAGGEGAFLTLLTAGHHLIDDGADVIVLGCAGMARHRAQLQTDLGVPVIDPTQAAVAQALGAILG
ncbi:aspartate/glutamate racemase family protein [Oceaniglobus trochenteri]|uniref:aspartate/glutamate racemase family protein n=1 Tax=Oceaniglobus trochenteri TaxID=2763260 RepID=UPI001CFF7E1D|nr:aspartate/glutamate racemase family protein [Oceaniglobus trochenteri]